MNRIYNIIWSKAREKWIVVSERVKSNGGVPKSPLPSLALLTAMMAAGSPAYGIDPNALPTGGQIGAGNGSISYSGNQMSVNQLSNQLIANWNSFNIGQNAGVSFYQPNSSAVALNRIADANPTQIFGSLTSNGNVFLLNPSGIVFGKTAQVDVGGLVASSLNISDSQFLSNAYRFQNPGYAGNVTNSGRINANGGVVALIAPKVSNEVDGSITTAGGTTALAAGNQVSVDFKGDGLISLTVDSGVVNALAANSGNISADGGLVLLTAKSAADITSSAVNNSGIITATSLQQKNGRIILNGNDGITTVSGKLDVSSAYGKGGDIVVSGNKVALQSGSILTASGVTAGGTIETSGSLLDINNVAVSAAASSPDGKAGTWTIGLSDGILAASPATAGQSATSTLLTSDIESTLNSGTNVTIAANGASGNITVESPVTKSFGTESTLALKANRNVVVNQDISADSAAGKLNIILSSANEANATAGGVDVNANLFSNGGNILVGGGAGGYALNLAADQAAVNIEENVSILSNGGNIAISGKSLVGENSGDYSTETSGVHIDSGTSILSGTGNLSITGVSSNAKTYGIGVESSDHGSSVIGSSLTGGYVLINGINSAAGNRGAIGLENGEEGAGVTFIAPTVANLRVKLNGATQLLDFTPKNSNHEGDHHEGDHQNDNNVDNGYRGKVSLPGESSEHLVANYNVGTSATKAIIVETGDGSKIYDGNTIASGLEVNTIGSGESGYSADGLTFRTASKNVGANYAILVDSDSNAALSPEYAVGYYTGSYAITPKAVTVSHITAESRIYNGLTNAVVSTDKTYLDGIIKGDDLTINATGVFDNKNVGNSKTVYLTSSYSGEDRGNYIITDQATTTADITPKQLTVSGITASDKVYDSTTKADVTATAASLKGLVEGDKLSVSATGAFADKNAGRDKTVTLASSYTGEDRSNYDIIDQTATTASITPKQLSVSGITADNKEYDATKKAVINVGAASLNGLIEGDKLNVTASGAFADKNVGIGKNVKLASSYAGEDLNNYNIIDQATTTASITPKKLSVSGIKADDKIYDATTNATVSATSASLNGLIDGDKLKVSATGVFSDKNVGVDKNVTLASSYSGEDKGNYSITGQESTTATITPKEIIVSGITAADKIYDATTSATVSATSASLNGLIAGDKLNVSATGAFTDKNVAIGKTVKLESSYTGEDKGNYVITDQKSTTATITPKEIIVSGITAENKTYDATTAATVSGTNATLGGLIAGDELALASTGSFTDKNAGIGKTVNLVNNYSGADINNYSIVDQTSAKATITPKQLLVSGITAENKNFDGTTTALTNTIKTVYDGLIPGDILSVSAEGAFDTPAVGAGKDVALSTSYTGADVNNYSIVSPTSTKADILAVATPPAPPAEVPVPAPPAEAPAPAPAPVPDPAPVNVGAPAITPPAGLVVQYVAAPSVAVTAAGTVPVAGEIDVTIPATSLSTGGGASFTVPLPEEVRTAATLEPETVSLENGQPLPSWITYDSVAKVFKASSVTTGDLASTVTVKLSIGVKSWKIVISSQK